MTRLLLLFSLVPLHAGELGKNMKLEYGKRGLDHMPLGQVRHVGPRRTGYAVPLQVPCHPQSPGYHTPAQAVALSDIAWAPASYLCRSNLLVTVPGHALRDTQYRGIQIHACQGTFSSGPATYRARIIRCGATYHLHLEPSH